MFVPIHPARGRSRNPRGIPLQESPQDEAGSCLEPRPRRPGRSQRPAVHDEFLIVSSNNETSCSEPGGATKPNAGEQGLFLLSTSGAMPSAPCHEHGDRKAPPPPPHHPIHLTRLLSSLHLD